MQRIALLMGILVANGLLACNSTSAPAAPGGGDDRIPPIGSEGDGGSGGLGPGGSGGGGQGGVGGAGGNGACESPADEESLASVTNPPTQNARQVSAFCGTVTCSDRLGQGQATFTQCASSCVEDSIPDLSEGCAACYGALAWCAQLLCNTACANAPCNEDSCINCTGAADYQACLAALDACTGRPSLDCE
jgi:hypothetical protein